MTDSNVTGFKKHRSMTALCHIAVLLCCCLLLSCAARYENPVYRPLDNTDYLPDPDVTLTVPGLSSCTFSDDPRLHLDSREPVVVIVHGCFSSAGRFRSLADVFAFHGQQAICFNYDDRDSLNRSAQQLADALEALSGVLRQPKIFVIGHSQGGLIARRALADKAGGAHVNTDSALIDLTTISAPFGGIRSSAHCGSTALAWFSFGLTKAICQLITGSKYKEIPPNSDFITEPGELLPSITRHIKIVTDESNTCRRYNKEGVCIEDDFVFSVAEQNNPAIDNGRHIVPVMVKAGHVEIVGDAVVEPQKLIAILQQQEVLKATPEGEEERLTLLLDRLYMRP